MFVTLFWFQLITNIKSCCFLSVVLLRVARADSCRLCFCFRTLPQTTQPSSPAPVSCGKHSAIYSINTGGNTTGTWRWQCCATVPGHNQLTDWLYLALTPPRPKTFSRVDDSTFLAWWLMADLWIINDESHKYVHNNWSSQEWHPLRWISHACSLSLCFLRYIYEVTSP